MNIPAYLLKGNAVGKFMQLLISSHTKKPLLTRTAAKNKSYASGPNKFTGKNFLGLIFQIKMICVSELYKKKN